MKMTWSNSTLLSILFHAALFIYLFISFISFDDQALYAKLPKDVLMNASIVHLPSPQQYVEKKEQPVIVKKSEPVITKVTPTVTQNPLPHTVKTAMPLVIPKKIIKPSEKQQKLEKQREQQAKKLAALKKQQELIKKQKAVQAQKIKQQKAKALAQKRKLQQEAETLMQQQLLADQNQLKQNQTRYDNNIITKYKVLIINAIANKWIVPPSASNDLHCVLRIQLAPGGAVLGVRLIKSSGNNAFDQSAMTAVYQASPLPVPTNLDLFNFFRELNLDVKPLKVV